FEQWDRLLRRETDGKVGIRTYPGGAAGDEKVLVRKMRAGQLDGAALTVTGLGVIARPSLVLAAPGVILDYEEIDLVRREMKDEFVQMFEDAGYVLLSWGDAGRTRMFSQKKIAQPRDLKSARPWVWTDNPVMVHFMRVVGANGVRLGVPEVYPGLQTGMIDTVVASAMTAIGLQWFTRLKYMSNETSGVLIGALVLRKDKFEKLPKDAQAIIRKTAEAGTRELQKARRMDDQAYRVLRKRGMKVVDTDPHRKKWEQAFRKTTRSLAGRLYSKNLLERVMSIVAKVRRDDPIR
ncbi:MAG: TRAP transporter substrate-binding protein DctP, partial [Myxococcota bacterium]